MMIAIKGTPDHLRCPQESVPPTLGKCDVAAFPERALALPGRQGGTVVNIVDCGARLYGSKLCSATFLLWELGRIT